VLGIRARRPLLHDAGAFGRPIALHRHDECPSPWGGGTVDTPSHARATRPLVFSADATVCKTRAASGIEDFQLSLNEAGHRAPRGELVDIMDVGYSYGFLSTPYARRMSRRDALCRQRREHHGVSRRTGPRARLTRA
jgi:hypothetical protein